jgi:hypothetical protein
MCRIFETHIDLASGQQQIFTISCVLEGPGVDIYHEGVGFRAKPCDPAAPQGDEDTFISSQPASALTTATRCLISYEVVVGVVRVVSIVNDVELSIAEKICPIVARGRLVPPSIAKVARSPTSCAGSSAIAFCGAAAGCEFVTRAPTSGIVRLFPSAFRLLTTRMDPCKDDCGAKLSLLHILDVSESVPL